MNQTRLELRSLSGVDSPAPASSVDTTACDRELVQFSGAIQPHGVLLALEEPRLLITEASSNTLKLFNKQVSDLLGQPLSHALAGIDSDWIVNRLHELKVSAVPAHVGTVTVQPHNFELFAHRMQKKLILEFEQVHSSPPPVTTLYADVRACMSELQSARDPDLLLEVAVRFIRKLTGFDRVVAFKFLSDETGKVLAEARRSDLSSFLGLHFPPGDVPAPARRVLSLVWVRDQPDTGYTPVPIQSVDPSAPPLDLSYSLLRSTSARCNRYYQNLGVRSKLVVALLRNGDLWGLIIGQGESVRFLSHETRMACETIAHTVSLLLHQMEDAAEARQAVQARQNVEALVLGMSDSPAWEVELPKWLLTCFPSGGGAVLVDSSLLLSGTTPSEPEVLELINWLESRDIGTLDEPFSTHSLASLFPAAAEYRAHASGLLALRIPMGEYLLWFRPEVPYEISWAGDPFKPIEVDETSGRLRLAPRSSFEMRRTLLQGISEPWRTFELDAALALRRAIVTLRRAEDLTRSLGELRASNSELESFAHIVSHDLREPLRGIRFQSELLSRGLGNSIGEKEQARIDTIKRVTTRMDDLLLALLHCSRIGKTQPQRKLTDLNVIFEGVLETLSHQLATSAAIVETDCSLPSVNVDPAQIHEILLNLIMNGLKYNLSPQKHVQAGFVDGAQRVFYVRDNGIGIAPENHQNVFRMYRRLHGADEYGGGTGAGLTIVQKMVEHHGGRVWIESTPGAGSTFFFTLPE